MPKSKKSIKIQSDPTRLREVQRVLFRITIEHLEGTRVGGRINCEEIAQEYRQETGSSIITGQLCGAIRRKIDSFTDPTVSTLEALKRWYNNNWPDHKVEAMECDSGDDNEALEEPAPDVFVNSSIGFRNERLKFLCIHYKENEVTKGTKLFAVTLIKKHGGEIVAHEHFVDAKIQGVYVICFGKYNKDVKDFLDAYDLDIYHPSLIFDSVRNGKFSPNSQMYASRSTHVMYMRQGLEKYTGTEARSDPAPQRMSLPCNNSAVNSPELQLPSAKTAVKQTIDISTSTDETKKNQGITQCVQTDEIVEVNPIGCTLETKLGDGVLKIMYDGFDPVTLTRLNLSDILHSDIKKTHSILKICEVFVKNNNSWNSLVPIQNHVYENDLDLPIWYKKNGLLTQDLKRFVQTAAFEKLPEQYPQLTPEFIDHVRTKFHKESTKD